MDKAANGADRDEHVVRRLDGVPVDVVRVRVENFAQQLEPPLAVGADLVVRARDDEGTGEVTIAVHSCTPSYVISPRPQSTA